MNNQNENPMFIPEHCCTDGNEITEGYGKKELLKSIPFILFGFGIGLVISIIRQSIIFPVLGLVIGASGGYIFCKKDRISRESVLDALVSLYQFIKSQKYYEFGGSNNNEKK